MRLNLALALLALLTCGSPTAVWAGAVSYADAPLGTVPAEFEAGQTGPGEPGRWEVVSDAEAAGGRAVAQSSQDRTDGRFPLLIRRAAAPADVAVWARIKPVAGEVDQAGGLAIRLLDPNNYYLVRANALEGNVRFYKVVGGQREQLAGVDLPMQAGTWHTLRLEARGDRFTVSFDGQELFAATDTAFTTPGKVAFWTKADSVTRFDALNVEPLQ
ncbi:hypothetical protein GCM10007886_33770 [Methylobacterium gregans]|uniref:Glycosyl hydrolase family 59 C-terminal lectin domain-containing protein n=1 Tax=Methylobacterium gregans TaxID=374424 RepID=A0AA37HPD4_9HYPH|nr:hypothetical protein [Methylobacterium gregans]MDQ0522447.1 hypothetical protein [Methylobacterium gregans]GJD79549.1 hypothetical protein NBEOAGPD_2778 [Methylobacterium gregans]GLS55193.1 hypothetical protein GCM10007886_33770 [Methylobacterium gregans]